MPLPGTDESEQRGNSVVARRAGRPRSARLAPATRHLPQILRSSFQARFHVRNTANSASAPTGAAAGARPGLSERCVYTTTRRLPRHAAHAPPRRTHSCPIAARAAWGPVGGGTAPRRRRKPPSAVTRVSATRPSRYVRVPASARAPWGLSVGWGRWPLRLAPEGRTWHPSIHNFALSGKSSQSQVSTCSGRARAPPARARGAWPFMAILCHTFSFVIPFFGEMRTCTRKVLIVCRAIDAFGPASLPSSCGSNA